MCGINHFNKFVRFRILIIVNSNKLHFLTVNLILNNVHGTDEGNIFETKQYSNIFESAGVNTFFAESID